MSTNSIFAGTIVFFFLPKILLNADIISEGDNELYLYVWVLFETMQCRSLSGSGAQKKAENVIGVPKDIIWIEGKTKTEI